MDGNTEFSVSVNSGRFVLAIGSPLGCWTGMLDVGGSYQLKCYCLVSTPLKLNMDTQNDSLYSSFQIYGCSGNLCQTFQVNKCFICKSSRSSSLVWCLRYMFLGVQSYC